MRPFTLICSCFALALAAPALAHPEPPDPEPPVSGTEDPATPDPAESGADKEVIVRAEARDSTAASSVVVGRRELEFRPIRRPSDVLEAGPGLFVAQHAGGGKATQFFLRGFDADHGTDVALFVDGVPVNLVSHGHGQGYSDLNFVIPELVIGLDVNKGPYFADLGDFATAGAANLRLVEAFPHSFVSYSLGQYGVQRGVVAGSPSLGDGWTSVVAGEVAEQDGPFQNPENYRRFNLFGRATRNLPGESKLSLTWMSYGGRWNGSGQIPARAVCDEGEAGFPAPEALGAPCIDRFGSVDPSEGGETQRHGAALSYARKFETSELTALVYATKYRWNLYSNFTFFDRDPLNGDGIEQADDRTLFGADLRLKQRHQIARSTLVTTVGVQARADSIDNALYDQSGRERTSTRVDAHIDESQLAVFSEASLQVLPQLRFVTGVRLQRIDAAVEDQLEDQATLGNTSSGTSGASLVLPKFSAIVTPLQGWELMANAGRGFHSNDARGTVLANDRVDLMTAALGYEVGTRVKPVRGLELYAAAYLLDLDSEQVWVGDEGTSEPSDATRRTGLEVGARAHLWRWFFADIDATFNKAVFVDNAGNAGSVALAPTRTLTAGVGVRPTFGKYTPFGSLRLKALADRPATEDGSLTAEGFTLFDAEAGVRYSHVEAALSVQNLLGTTWREVNFATTSRLPYESQPGTGIHYAPGWPRTVMGRVNLYW